jgi:hypothetical protein
MKPVRAVLSQEAEEAYKYLNSMAPNSKIERSILNSIKTKTEPIKINIHYGSPVSKERIPIEYRIKYGVTNLFHVELSNFWRMLYTITNDESEIEIIAFVLDIIDHKIYNKNLDTKGTELQHQQTCPFVSTNCNLYFKLKSLSLHYKYFKIHNKFD